MYVTVDMVRAAVPPRNLLALCDDENAGGAVADANPALQLAIQNAHSEVTSNLATIYGDMGAPMPAEQPGIVSALLINAELAYVKFYLYDRKPDLAAKIGEKFLSDLWKRAQDRMDRVKDAVQEIAPNDHPPAAPPANVGGVTVDRGAPKMGDDGTGGAFNVGDY